MKNKKRKIYVLIGIIASGKTTYAKNLLKEDKNIQRVSRDDLRFMTTDYQYTPDNEKIVDTLYRNLIVTLILNTDKDIILDEQNLDKDRREKFKEWILSLSKNIEFIEKEFPITLGQAIERDKKRDFSIGESVIKKTWHKYEITLKQMIEREKPKYPWNSKLPYCIIVDIDGTLAHSPNRRIFDFKEVINDELITPVWSILDKYTYVCDIILLSGRGEDCREETEEWLSDKSIPYEKLYMRKAKDNRSDVIIKTELFEEHIRDKYQPIFVIDDRPVVLEEVWQKLGVFTFNVNQDARCRNDF